MAVLFAEDAREKILNETRMHLNGTGGNLHQYVGYYCWCSGGGGGLLEAIAFQLFSRFENLRELVGDLPHNLLISGAAFRLLAEDSGENLHQVLLAVLVLCVPRVSHNLSAQLQVPLANLKA